MQYAHLINRVFVLRRYAVVLLCAAVLGMSHAAIADDQAWQTLGQLEFPKNSPTAFSEARKTRLQRKAKIQSGELWLTNEGVLVMSIQKPRAELRKVSATQLSIERGRKTRSLTLDPSRAAHQLPLIIVDVLNGDTTRLRDSFRVAATSKNSIPNNKAQAAGWRWRLEPIDTALDTGLTALVLGGEGNRLLTLRTERGSSFQEITILPEPAKSK